MGLVNHSVKRPTMCKRLFLPTTKYQSDHRTRAAARLCANSGRGLWQVALLAAWLGMSCDKPSGAADGSTVRVAAASDLAVALPKLNEAWHANAAPYATFTFAASRKLSEQIAQGADFDVALLAGSSNLDRVMTTGRCNRASRIRVGAGPWAQPTDAAERFGRCRHQIREHR